MSLQVLYRPKSFKTFAGNDEIKKNLQEIVKRKNPPSSFLIVGGSGCGKCITGDSLILTDKGIKSIESFSKNVGGFSPLETNIFNGNQIETTSHFFEEITTQTISIKNELGMELEGTYEHPILCLSDHNTFEFKQLQNISEEDFVCIPRKSNIFNNTNHKINFIQNKKSRDSNSIPLINIPKEVDTNIAKLLGYIIANGCKNGNGISVSTKNKEYQKDIKNILNNWGQKIGKIKEGKDFSVGSMWMGKFVCYLLQEDSLPTARNKKIPSCILEGTKEIQVAFLQKLIDCDSWWRDHVLIEYNTASEVLAKQVQLLLLNLGIISVLNNKYVKEYDHIYWGVKICGEQLDKYLDIVGSTKYKQHLSIKRNTNKDIIPFLGSFIKEKIQKIRKDLKVSKSGHFYYKHKTLRFKVSRENLLSSKNITYNNLNCIYNDLNKIPQIISVLELKKTCELFLNSYYFFSKVKNIKRNKKEIKVYDFTMPNSHSFLSNGYISHNTTLGRIIAKKLGCKKDDYKEINTANDRTLPAIRSILDDLKYTPMAGKKKVILLDECHQLQSVVQEALLKGLEEPPSHVHFILCTTNPEALKDTFKRRCHIYEVQPLNSNQMMKHLKSILKKEKVKDFKEPVLEKIIELSNGSPGIALKYLDMVIDITDEEEAINLLKTSGTSEKDVLELCRTLVDFRVNGKTRWGKIRKILLNFNGDAESARRPILGYLNTCLLKNPEGDNFALIMDEFKDNFMYSGKAGLSLACYKAVFMIED